MAALRSLEPQMRREDSDDEEYYGSEGAEDRGGAAATGRRQWVRWTAEEHAKLAELVQKHGVNRSWSLIASHIPGRTGKQCRERWLNHTTETSKKGSWAPSEEYVLAQQHSLCGSQWCRISRSLPGRTDNSVKNHWNATWRSKVMHKPQSILWLYSSELKRGQSPPTALRRALLQWENNVPSHLVMDTLGFWPSQEYAGSGSSSQNNNRSKASPGGGGNGAGDGGMDMLAQAASLTRASSMPADGLTSRPSAGQQQQHEQQQQQGGSAEAMAAAQPQPAGVAPMDTEACGGAASASAAQGNKRGAAVALAGQRAGSNNCSDDSCVSKMTVQPPTPTPAPAAAAPHGALAQHHLHHHVHLHHHHGGAAASAAGDLQLPPAPVLVVNPSSLSTPSFAAPALPATGAAPPTGALRPGAHQHQPRAPISPGAQSEQLSAGTLARRSQGSGTAGSVPVPPASAALLEAAAMATDAEAAAAAAIVGLARRASHDSSSHQSRPTQPSSAPPPSSFNAAAAAGNVAAAAVAHQPQLVVVPPTPAAVSGGPAPVSLAARQGCPLVVTGSSGHQVMLPSGGVSMSAAGAAGTLPPAPELVTAAPTLHLGGGGMSGMLAAAPQQVMWHQHDGGLAHMAAVPHAAAAQQVVWLAGPDGTLTPHCVMLMEPQPHAAAVMQQHPQQQQVLFVPPPGAVMLPPSAPFGMDAASAPPTMMVPAPGAFELQARASGGSSLMAAPPQQQQQGLLRSAPSGAVTLPPHALRPSGSSVASVATAAAGAGALHTAPSTSVPGDVHHHHGAASFPTALSLNKDLQQQQQQGVQFMRRSSEATGGAPPAQQVVTLVMRDGQLVLGQAGGAPAAPTTVGMPHQLSGGFTAMPAGADGSGSNRPSVDGAGFGAAQQVVTDAGGVKVVLSQHQQQTLLHALLAQQGISLVV